MLVEGSVEKAELLNPDSSPGSVGRLSEQGARQTFDLFSAQGGDKNARSLQLPRG
jgi:hypothetical protein